MLRTPKDGEVIHGPNGQGYVVQNAPRIAEPIRAEHFRPFGGAPEPKPNQPMPDFLIAALKVEA